MFLLPKSLGLGEDDMWNFLMLSISLDITFTYGILGKTYDVSPYDSPRSHPLMDLGVKWDLCVLFVQTAVKCQDCKFV